MGSQLWNGVGGVDGVFGVYVTNVTVDGFGLSFADFLVI